MKITVRKTYSYGHERIFPICEKGKLLAELAGHKTLTRPDIEIIKKLGYEVVTEQLTL